MPYSAYSLPRVVAQQYILSSVHDEDADTVTYAATQKNMSREVLLRSLRPSAMQDARKVQFFVETARLQARLEHPNIAAPLDKKLLVCPCDATFLSGYSPKNISSSSL